MDAAGLTGAIYPAFCCMFDCKLQIKAPWPPGKPLPAKVRSTTLHLALVFQHWLAFDCLQLGPAFIFSVVMMMMVMIIRIIT
jgi:hypothetical protein